MGARGEGTVASAPRARWRLRPPPAQPVRNLHQWPPAPTRRAPRRSPGGRLRGVVMYDVADSAFTTVIVTALYAPIFQQGRRWRLGAGRPSLGGWRPRSRSSLGRGTRANPRRDRGFLRQPQEVPRGVRRDLDRLLHGLALVRRSRDDDARPRALHRRQRRLCGRRRLHRQLSAGHLQRIERRPHLRPQVGLRLCQRSGRELSLPRAVTKNVVANPTPDQLARARLIPVVVAAYYAIAVIPTFLFLRDRSQPRTLPPGESSLTVGFRQLRQTLRHGPALRELVKLLIAFLVYNDGVVTVIYFADASAPTRTMFGFSTKRCDHVYGHERGRGRRGLELRLESRPTGSARRRRF